MKNLLYGLLALLSPLWLAAQPGSCFSLYMASANAQPGDTICLEVRGDGLNDFLSMQFSMRWDPAALRFSAVSGMQLPGLSEDSFNTSPSAVDSGVLNVAWFDFSLLGVSLPDGSPLFSVCFEVLAGAPGRHEVRFAGSPVSIEFVQGPLPSVISTYSLIHGGLYTGSGSLPEITAACAFSAGCQGGPSAIDIEVGGGQPDYSYSWLAGGQLFSEQEDLSGSLGGTYELIVEDAAGLTATALFSLEPGGGWQHFYTYECAENSGSYTAAITCSVSGGGAPPFHFAWSNGQEETAQSASTISGLQGSGAYNVTVTDANGCLQVADSFYLDCAAFSGFLSSYTYQCFFLQDGSSLGGLSLGVWAGGTPPYHFEWSTGLVQVDSFVSMAEGLPGGLYSVTVTDANGLVFYPEPFLLDCGPPPGDFLVGFSYDCELFPDTAIATVSALVWSGGVPPYTFEWNTGEVDVDNQLSQVTGPGQGVYSLVITDSEGTVFVPDPVAVDCSFSGAPKLAIGEGSAPAGGAVCLPVTAGNFSELDSLQLTISWDASGLQLASVQPGLIEDGFGLSGIGAGNLQLSWSSGNAPLSITDESVLFTLCFNILGNPGQAFPVYFNGWQSLPQAFSAGGQEMAGVQWQNGAVLAESVSGEGVLLSTGSAVVETGAPVCVPVVVQQFENIIGAQFSVRWKADSLLFDSLLLGPLPNLSPVNFNLNNTGDGYLIFQWLDPTLAGVSLPDGAALFSLCFTAGSQPGSSAVSVSSVPTAIELTNSSLEVEPVALSNGQVTILQPDVWPGDTDESGLVNHYDLLPVGLAYGATGPERPNATILWEEQAAPGWGLNTPVSQVDFKHIDTDGNGLVDAADTLAIVQNWGQAANFSNPGPPPTRAPNAVLFVQPDTLVLGEQAIFDIVLGDAGQPAEEVYGLAFTIVYDTSAVEPGAFATFANSWMGEPNSSLLGLSRDRYEDGSIDIALTRIDGQNASGYGPIAQLHITIQDVIFMRSMDYPMIFRIENVRLIDAQEQFLGVQPLETIAVVEDAVSNTSGFSEEEGVEVFPVPAREVLYLRSPLAPVQEAELLSLDGRSLARYRQPRQIPLNALPAGAYLLRVWTERGSSIHRVVVAP